MQIWRSWLSKNSAPKSPKNVPRLPNTFPRRKIGRVNIKAEIYPKATDDYDDDDDDGDDGNKDQYDDNDDDDNEDVDHDVEIDLT